MNNNNKKLLHIYVHLTLDPHELLERWARCFTWDGSFILPTALVSGGKLFSPIDKLGNSSSES